MNPPISRRSTAVALIIITLLSFYLRLWGIQFGLPFEYHPDEQQYILPAIRVVSGDFQPLAHYNPALYPYLIGLVYSLTYYGLQLFGAEPPLFDLNNGWHESMIPWTIGWIYLARYVSVAVGVINTLLIYQLGRRAYNRLTGLGAALIFTVSFLPTREAHFAVNDAPVALAVTVTLYCCIGMLRHGALRDYLWTGIALGLATAVKYSAGLLVVPIGVAYLLQGFQISPMKEISGNRYRFGQHLRGQKQTSQEKIIYLLRNLWKPILTGLVAMLVFALCSPYTLIEYDLFWANFSENLESARSGFQGLDLDPSGGAVYYLKVLLWGFGWPLLIVFGLSILYLLWRHLPIDLLMLSFPLFGFFYMQRQEMYFMRWLMPFIPPLMVITAESITVWSIRLSNWLGKQFSFDNTSFSPKGESVTSLLLGGRVFGLPQRSNISNVYWSVVFFVYLFLLLPTLYATTHANYVFSKSDTRTEALYWIRDNIPAGTSLAVEVRSPPWGPPLAMPGLAVGSYNFYPVPDGGVAELDMEQYRQQGVSYVIASSFHYARPLRDKTHQALLEQRMAWLEEQAKLVALFDPFIDEERGYFHHDQVFGPANDLLLREHPGPVIRVYRLPH
ncbi:glycosyltransferase family 39 protein [Anaerolineales bacterium HSG25]|nr:glycosyltransferase family 39 protein [Anaerolineales bacterium HSG25]